MIPLARAIPAALLVVALPLAGAHHAVDPDAPYDFRNSEPSTFGSVDMPVYLDAPAGAAVELEVPMTLHPGELPSPAARYLVGFNLHDDAVRLEDVAVTREGKPVAFERDDRGSTLQPRVIIPGDALPRDGPVDLLLTGTATASEDGRMHVGALAIAFDAAWGTLHTKDGAAAQVYSFTLLMSKGHPSAGLAPRFHGEGNSAVALMPIAAMLGLTVLGLRSAHLRLHAPPKAAQPAAVAKPSPTPRPAPVRAPAPAPAPIPRPPVPTVTPFEAPPAPTFAPFDARPTPAPVSRPTGPMTVPTFAPVVDPLARTPRPRPLPVAIIRRKQRPSDMPIVSGSPLRVGRVATESPLASAASSVVARPPRPPRASQAKARESPFAAFAPRDR